MNPILRFGPYLYSALHSYNSVWELLLTPSERKIAARDAERLATRFPFLARYESMSRPLRDKLTPEHRTYTRDVSPDPIAISFELSVFLASLCEQVRPAAILDLGSGFSSYVFRSYAKDAKADVTPVVYSIDHSADWLRETRRFLEPRELDCGHLVTWDEFVAGDRPSFDLVLLDMADLGTRLQMLDVVIDSCRTGGMIIVDDMHVPSYRRSILAHVARRRLEAFSLRTFTKKRLRHAYLILP